MPEGTLQYGEKYTSYSLMILESPFGKKKSSLTEKAVTSQGRHLILCKSLSEREEVMSSGRLLKPKSRNSLS